MEVYFLLLKTSISIIPHRGHIVSGCGLVLSLSHPCVFWRIDLDKAEKGAKSPQLYWGELTPLSLVQISVLLNSWLTACKRWFKIVSTIVQIWHRAVWYKEILVVPLWTKEACSPSFWEAGGNILRNCYTCTVSCWMGTETAILEERCFCLRSKVSR